MILLLHILAGGVAIASGALAFSVKKGGNVHRKSGLIFVISMLLMALTASVLAILKGEYLNAVAGGLTFYLVATAFMIVRPPKQQASVILWGFTLLAILVSGFGFFTGVSLTIEGISTIDGRPIQVLYVFSSVSALAAFLDIKMQLKSLNRKQRLLRHIWRIGLAMFLAVASFFLGQAQVFPEVIRTITVLAPPVLATLLATVFWFVKVKFWGLKH